MKVWGGYCGYGSSHVWMRCVDVRKKLLLSTTCNYAPDGMLLFIRRQQGRIEKHRSTQAIWRLSSALNILRLFTLGIYVMG